MNLLNLKRNINEKLTFFLRVFKIANTWGILNILKFIPYEIFYAMKFKVNTLFSVNHQELDVPEALKRNSTEYFPTPYYVANKVFKLVKQQLKDSEFIDFGCGAGRILMFVTNFKPKKIIGIEFSKQLCEQAENNLKNYLLTQQELSCDWEIIHSDALEYSINPSANIFFFYDPFNEKIMKTMVKKINLSVEQNPRPILIVYISPIHRNIFIQSGYNILHSNVNKHNKGYVIIENT